MLCGEIWFEREPDWKVVQGKCLFWDRFELGNFETIFETAYYSESDQAFILPLLIRPMRPIEACFTLASELSKDNPALPSGDISNLIQKAVKQDNYKEARNIIENKLEAFFKGAAFLDCFSFSELSADNIWQKHVKKLAGISKPRADSQYLVAPKIHCDTNQNSATKDLEHLVGLSEVKRRIAEIIAFINNVGPAKRPCLHMVFKGNPGTGKTTVARLIAKSFAEEGIIKDPNTFVETDRSGLVGEYIGHTAMKTKEIIERARGGVLFIDEAYALGMYSRDLGASPDRVGGRRDFGFEAISTLVKEMEDKRDDLICILAGYPKEMEYMLNANPGLRDRIGFYIDFPDYSTAEQMEVFEVMAAEKGLTVSPEAYSLLYEAFARNVHSADENFSNGRLVRRVFERAWMKHVLAGNGETLSEKTVISVLAEADFAPIFKPKEISVFGFAAGCRPALVAQ